MGFYEKEGTINFNKLLLENKWGDHLCSQHCSIHFTLARQLNSFKPPFSGDIYEVQMNKYMWKFCEKINCYQHKDMLVLVIVIVTTTFKYHMWWTSNRYPSRVEHLMFNV